MVEKIIKLVPTIIGACFVLAGLLKAYDASELNRLLLFDHFPARWVTPIVWFIIQGEIILGCTLVFRIATRLAVALAIGVLVVFAGQLAYLLAYSNPPACGCLGNLEIFKSTRAEALFGLVRNGVMLAALACYWRYGKTGAMAPCLKRAGDIN